MTAGAGPVVAVPGLSLACWPWAPCPGACLANRCQAVAFKACLRTPLHGLCHHLFYDALKLRASFHTAGAFQHEPTPYFPLMDTNAR